MNTVKPGKISPKKLSFDEYDKMVERFDRMGYRPEWPDATLVEKIEMNVKKKSIAWLRFCCFIVEKAPEPVSENDKESKKKLLELINTYLALEEKEE